MDVKNFLEKLKKGEVKGTVEDCESLQRYLNPLHEELKGCVSEWLPIIIGNICSNIPSVRIACKICLESTQPYLCLSRNDTLTEVICTLAPNIQKDMLNLLEVREVAHSIQCWSLLIRLLGNTLHKSRNVVNIFLAVLEKAFKVPSPQTQVAAYGAWNDLIKNFSQDMAILTNTKRMKLLLQPLCSTKTPTEEVLLAKSNTWWFFMNALGEHLGPNFEKICLPFFEMSFGISFRSEYKDRSLLTSSRVPPSYRSYQNVLTKGCEVLLRLLEPPPSSLSPMKSPKRGPNLATSALKVPFPNSFFAKQMPVFVKLAKEASDHFITIGKLPFALLIFQHFQQRIAILVKDESRENGEVISLYLKFVRACIVQESIGPISAFKIIEDTSQILPDHVLSSHLYHQSAASSDLMNTVPALDFLQLLFNDKIFDNVHSNNSFLPLFSRLIEVGMKEKNSTLKFMKNIFTIIKSKVPIEGSPLSQERSKFIASLWVASTNALRKRVEELQDVNEGDTLEHDFSCLLMALTFPLGFLLLHPTNSTMTKIWEDLCRSFFKIASFETLVEKNCCCEELSLKLLDLLNSKKVQPGNHFWRWLCKVNSVILDCIDFEVVNNGGLKLGINITPETWKRKNNKPIGNMSSFVILLDATTKEIISSPEAKIENLVSCIETIQNLFKLISKSEIIVGIICSLTPALKSLLTKPTIGEKIKNQCLSHIESLRSCFVDIIMSRYKGPHGSTFLEVLRPLFEITLIHHQSSIQDKSRHLWVNIFGANYNSLLFPESLKCILRRVNPPLVPSCAVSTEDNASDEVVIIASKPKTVFLSVQNSLTSKPVPITSTSVKRTETPKRRLEEMNENEFVKIDSAKKGQSKSLTEHQKEALKSKSYLPAMYNDLSQSSQLDLLTDSNTTSDSLQKLPEIMQNIVEKLVPVIDIASPPSFDSQILEKAPNFNKTQKPSDQISVTTSTPQNKSKVEIEKTQRPSIPISITTSTPHDKSKLEIERTSKLLAPIYLSTLTPQNKSRLENEKSPKSSVPSPVSNSTFQNKSKLETENTPKPSVPVTTMIPMSQNKTKLDVEKTPKPIFPVTITTSTPQNKSKLETEKIPKPSVPNTVSTSTSQNKTRMDVEKTKEKEVSKEVEVLPSEFVKDRSRSSVNLTMNQSEHFFTPVADKTSNYFTPLTSKRMSKDIETRLSPMDFPMNISSLSKSEPEEALPLPDEMKRIISAIEATPFSEQESKITTLEDSDDLIPSSQDASEIEMSSSRKLSMRMIQGAPSPYATRNSLSEQNFSSRGKAMSSQKGRRGRGGMNTLKDASLEDSGVIREIAISPLGGISPLIEAASESSSKGNKDFALNQTHSINIETKKQERVPAPNILPKIKSPMKSEKDFSTQFKSVNIISVSQIVKDKPKISEDNLSKQSESSSELLNQMNMPLSSPVIIEEITAIIIPETMTLSQNSVPETMSFSQQTQIEKDISSRLVWTENDPKDKIVNSDETVISDMPEPQEFTSPLPTDELETQQVAVSVETSLPPDKIEVSVDSVLSVIEAKSDETVVFSHLIPNAVIPVDGNLPVDKEIPRNLNSSTTEIKSSIVFTNEPQHSNITKKLEVVEKGQPQGAIPSLKLKKVCRASSLSEGDSTTGDHIAQDKGSNTITEANLKKRKSKKDQKKMDSKRHNSCPTIIQSPSIPESVSKTSENERLGITPLRLKLVQDGASVVKPMEQNDSDVPSETWLVQNQELLVEEAFVSPKGKAMSTSSKKTSRKTNKRKTKSLSEDSSFSNTPAKEMRIEKAASPVLQGKSERRFSSPLSRSHKMIEAAKKTSKTSPQAKKKLEDPRTSPGGKHTYSPTASPVGSILRLKRNEKIPPSSPSSTYKRRRVSFADPPVQWKVEMVEGKGSEEPTKVLHRSTISDQSSQLQEKDQPPQEMDAEDQSDSLKDKAVGKENSMADLIKEIEHPEIMIKSVETRMPNALNNTESKVEGNVTIIENVNKDLIVSQFEKMEVLEVEEAIVPDVIDEAKDEKAFENEEKGCPMCLSMEHTELSHHPNVLSMENSVQMEVTVALTENPDIQIDEVGSEIQMVISENTQSDVVVNYTDYLRTVFLQCVENIPLTDLTEFNTLVCQHVANKVSKLN